MSPSSLREVLFRCVISIPPGMLIEAIGFGVPSLVVIISYSLVYIKLTQSGENAEVTSLKKAVLVLTVCYFIFMDFHSFSSAYILPGKHPNNRV